MKIKQKTLIILFIVALLILICLMSIKLINLSNDNERLESLSNTSLSFDEVMNLFYPHKSSDMVYFDRKTEYYDYINISYQDNREPDPAYIQISCDENNNINLYAHQCKYEDKPNQYYFDKKIQITGIEEEIVSIAVKTWEIEPEELEYLFVLTRNGNLYYYTRDMLFDEDYVAKKFELSDKVIKIDIGFTLESVTADDGFVCADNAGNLIATTYNGSVYQIYPESRSLNLDDTYTICPAVCEKIK